MSKSKEDIIDSLRQLSLIELDFLMKEGMRYWNLAYGEAEKGFKPTKDYLTYEYFQKAYEKERGSNEGVQYYFDVHWYAQNVFKEKMADIFGKEPDESIWGYIAEAKGEIPDSWWGMGVKPRVVKVPKNAKRELKGFQ